MLTGLLLAAQVAWAVPEDALDPAVRLIYEAAARSERAREWRKAVAGYRLVLSREPAFGPAVVGLGRALEVMGDTTAARDAYASLPNEPDAVEALARLIEPEEPEAAAALYTRLQTLRFGDPQPHLLAARALTRVDPLAALDGLRFYLDLVDGAPDGPALVEIGVALQADGHEAEAVELLEGYVEAWPEGESVDEARGRLERWAVERAARALAVGGAEPLPEAAQAQMADASRRAARGQVQTALGELRELVRAWPRSAEAWAALGDVYAAEGEVAEAERAYVWAVALSPDESAWHARLGLLLADRYGGRRHREAADELVRAIGLRPSWAELHHRLGLVFQQLGDWDSAAASLRAYLDAEPDGAWAADAAARLADLTREAPPPPAAPAAAGCSAAVSEALCDQYRVARVYRDRGEPGAAREELAPVLAEAPGWPAALNLLAALEQDAGRPEAAADAWRRSLEGDPAQPGVLLALGEVARQEGRAGEARALFSRAAGLGAADAWYYLAEMTYADREVEEAGRELDAYFAASAGGLSHEPALALRARVDEHIRSRRRVGGGMMGGAALIGGLWLLLRRRRVTVRELAQLAPESVHDLSRALVAIRHEVLKHNTTLLGEVASALEHGDHHAVAFAAVRLFGEPGSDEGIIARFEGYLSAMEGVGRRHGVRLDLRRRDPVLGPMIAGMRRLRGMERALRRPWSARSGLAGDVLGLARALNVDSYQALGQLIREMSTFVVTGEVLAAVDERVRAEPAFADAVLPPLDLEVPEGGLPARVFRGDLEDITANLLRNAYRALVGSVPEEERQAGLRLDEEDDMVTGLEEVVLRFFDNAPGTLTDAMIRGREVGRGLGLVVDLITRHNGSIHVERGGGPYTKAVAVRLPRAESPGGLEEAE